MTSSKKHKIKHSYAILLYRFSVHGKVEVFLIHENGPQYWVKKHSNVWGLPKGKKEPKETPFEAATREFKEETGVALPKSDFYMLGRFYNKRDHKMVTVFAGETVSPVAFKGSANVVKEWPAHTGNFIVYPEILTANWFNLRMARKIILPGQKQILKKFKKFLKQV